jgi:hypothetical protein
MIPSFSLRSWKQHLPQFILIALTFTAIMVGAPNAMAQAAANGNPLQDWTVVNGNAGTAGTIGMNVFHFFMWALMGVIVIFGIKSCIAAASSGQTQQLWPRILATVLGLAIPYFVNWITTTGG